jgi:hypothetical protein
MANGNIINYSADGKMRVDLTFGVGYGENHWTSASSVAGRVMNAQPIGAAGARAGGDREQTERGRHRTRRTPLVRSEGLLDRVLRHLEQGIIALQASWHQRTEAFHERHSPNQA